MAQHSESPEERTVVIERYISRMPSLSTTAMKVSAICNNPHTSPAELNRVISLDPVLTGRVLKLVNSAYYGLPSQVSSLTRAIIMLGLNTVINLAISTAVVEKVSINNSSGALSIDAFWTHSLCVGVAAKLLSGVRGVPTAGQEEYFVGGLLHDLGKVVLNECFPEEYRQVFDAVKGGQASLSEVESEVFGVDHSKVGLMIAGKWQLSPSLGSTLAYHHHYEDFEGDGRDLVGLVYLGDMIANRLQMGSPGYAGPDEPALSAMVERMGLSPIVLTDYEEKVLKEIEKARVFIQVSTKS